MIKLYIANLGKYNEGELVGDWIELPCSDDELNELFVKIKLGYLDEDGDYHHGLVEGYSTYEEYAIHDFECDIEGLKIREYSSISDLNELSERFDDMRDDEKLAFQAIMSNEFNKNIKDALDEVDEGDWRIYYDCDDMGDVAREVLDEQLINMPDFIQNHFNYDSYGEELEMTGTFVSIGNGYVELY